MTPIFIGLGIDTIEFIIAALSGWLVLRILDKLAKIKFRAVYEEMRASGKLHWYHSARFLGVCLLAAAVYGR